MTSRSHRVVNVHSLSSMASPQTLLVESDAFQLRHLSISCVLLERPSSQDLPCCLPTVVASG